jgi:predicted choloylglycine hydrolase
MTQRATRRAPASSLEGDPGATTFYGIREAWPGRQWKTLYETTAAAYRAWYLSEGERARPTLATASRMLERHMPELVPTWDRLTDLTGGDETASRMLTLWNPPKYLPGCSQAVLVGERPLLVRNYDYRPDLCERVVYSSAFTGRRVLGTSDCLWGLLDGMNDAGLAVSLAFGGRPGAGKGFGIPLVVRYLLEVAETLADVKAALSGLPVSMAYNLTVLDRNGDVATVFVAPGAEPELLDLPVATNHRGLSPDWPEHAGAFRSVERQRVLLEAVEAGPDAQEFVAGFLRPPLYNTAYDKGFGTMYTAAYQPHAGVVDYLWPESTWRRRFDSPSGTHTVTLGGTGTSTRSRPAASLDSPSRRADACSVRWNPDAEDATPDELADVAGKALSALAESKDPAAFAHLLHLSQQIGTHLAVSARNLAEGHSWSGVADVAGTTRQAAWARWSGH